MAYLSPHLLSSRGIIPGIKVDKGAKPLALYPVTKSLKAWTVCATGLRNISNWGRNSRSGGR